MALSKVDDRGLNTPIDLLDNEKLRFGTGNDLEIYHNSTSANIINTTGLLKISAGSSANYIQSDSNVWITKNNAAETMAKFSGDGAVELYYDNSKKFQTYASGVEVLGNLWLQSGGSYFSDNVKANFGTSQDLQIYHNGTDSVIREEGTGNLNLQSTNSNVNVYVNTNELAASFIPNGAVELYHDNTKRIETTSNGATVTGSVVADNIYGRNMVLNGGMEVAQRLSFQTSGRSIAAGVGDYYGIDMFVTRNNSCTFLVSQSSDAPVGFSKSLKVDITSADTSLAASAYNTIAAYIEGYDIVRTGFGATGAKTLTLSFYIKSNLTGTFTGSIGNSSNNRSYAFDYTISSANTWERKTITFAGDTTGTWNKDTTMGLKITWALGVGSQYLTSTATTWQADEHMGTTNGQNVLASTANELILTGVQLEVGSVATTFEHKPFADEFKKCCRYYQKSRQYGQPNQEAAQIWNTPEASMSLSKTVNHYDTLQHWCNGTMRVNPTIKFYGSGSGTNDGTTNQHRFEIPGTRNDQITRTPDTITVNRDGFFCRLSLPTGTPDDGGYRVGNGNAFVRMTYDASAEF